MRGVDVACTEDGCWDCTDASTGTGSDGGGATVVLVCVFGFAEVFAERLMKYPAPAATATIVVTVTMVQKLRRDGFAGKFNGCLIVGA